MAVGPARILTTTIAIRSTRPASRKAWLTGAPQALRGKSGRPTPRTTPSGSSSRPTHGTTTGTRWLRRTQRSVCSTGDIASATCPRTALITACSLRYRYIDRSQSNSFCGAAATDCRAGCDARLERPRGLADLQIQSRPNRVRLLATRASATREAARPKFGRAVSFAATSPILTQVILCGT